MNIERLKELKQQVFDDFQLYEVKMQNSFEESMKEVTPTGEMDEAGNDLTSLIDAEIARQSVREMAVCPNCNGSGVYQEYDEYDRYHVHACYKCEGTGEIARQSVTSEEVAEAIEQFRSEYVDDFEGYPATCEKWNRKR